MKHADLLPILTADPWFGSIAPEHQALLLDNARLKSFANGGAIYRVGDPPDGMYGVVEGEIRFVSYPETGRQLLNYMVRPGGWFGEASLIDGGPRPHDAIFVGPLSVLFVSSDEFFALAKAAPAIYRDIARLTCLHYRTALVHLAGALMLSPERRLARWLLHFCVGQTHATDGQRINQEDLASAVGVSRQTLSKILKKLEGTGMLRIHYGSIEVTDSQALRSVAYDEVG